MYESVKKTSDDPGLEGMYFTIFFKLIILKNYNFLFSEYFLLLYSTSCCTFNIWHQYAYLQELQLQLDQANQD